jgi:hypothetical protein
MQDSGSLEAAWYPTQSNARWMLEHRQDPKRWVVSTVKDGVATFRFQYTSNRTDPGILTAMVTQETGDQRSANALVETFRQEYPQYFR